MARLSFLHKKEILTEIQKFWTIILDICSKELQLQIFRDPAVILLHHNEHSVASYKRSLTRYALNAAKLLIPRKWKSPQIPTLTEWIMEMEDIRKYEDLHADSYKAKRNHWATWRLWIQYVILDYLI
ncbi:hypothetical protein XELAEV_18030902mg [Xenopus laevis]|uniref:Uncharacterized protein n=1 Tax=Xenopus laevis TaxID=8355 RepID=A0A974CLK9_XENLA|nr:hypothetical protein XELAEV_18030902mg [Xenopus laevis]